MLLEPGTLIAAVTAYTTVTPAGTAGVNSVSAAATICEFATAKKLGRMQHTDTLSLCSALIGRSRIIIICHIAMLLA